MKVKVYSFFLLFIVAICFSNLALAQLRPETMQQVQLLLQEKSSRTPAQQKIDSRLLQAEREKSGLGMVNGVNLERANVNADGGGNLEVDITADVTDDLLQRLQSLGAKIIFPSVEYRQIRAVVNLSVVDKIAAFREVRFVRPAAVALISGTGTSWKGIPGKGRDIPGKLEPNSVKRATDVSSFKDRSERIRKKLEAALRKKYLFAPAPYIGTVTAEGDRTHRADDARNTFGYAGQGIRIGVLSDSYNSRGEVPSDIATGNLPGPGNPFGNTIPVTVLQDANGTDEGRAMLQIVHDLAPKAQLYFAAVFGGQAGFATAIRALRSAPNNCDIIIDDVSYSDEATFQDDIVAQGVNSVTADGALYFSSAGNQGSLAKNTSGVWEGDFTDTGSPAFTFPNGAKAGTIHNFGTPGAPVGGNIILAAGSHYDLDWADPLGRSSNDYDLFLVSATGTIKAFSTNIQNGSQDPYEYFTAPALAAGDRIIIFKATSAQPRALHLNTYRGRFTNATTGQTNGHSSAIDAFSVSATPAIAPGPFPNAFAAGNQVETFTSDGPRRMFFNADSTAVTPGNFLFASNGGVVRNKPDITAADGVSTTLPSGLNPFYGTSAAAPHAGAIAALIKSANPALTPAQVRNILITTALDIETPGYDNVSGYGILQAFQAMQAVNPAPSANISLGTQTVSEGSFNNGNNIVDPGENASLVVQLNNPSLATATGVSAIITTTTPGITITQGAAAYGAIAASASASNTATPFLFTVNNSLACGSVINFYMSVTFQGGASPQGFNFAIVLGAQPFLNITSTLDSTAPQPITGVTVATGVQTGRLNRSTTGVVSACGVPRSAPGLASATGARLYDAYTFTNTSPTDQCVNIVMSSARADSLFTVAYNDSGFVPSNPNLHYLGDAGNSFSPQVFSINVPVGKTFTVVVHSVNPAQAFGFSYTLNVSLSTCGSPPPCTPVDITTTRIDTGATGVPYSQAFAGSGGSGNLRFTLTGQLPAGLSFFGNTLAGTPTQAGRFPISIIAIDPAGCPSDTMNYTLVVTGLVPATITVVTGTPQTAFPTDSFPVALQAIVRDSSNNPLPGVAVTFRAPGSGASGRFAGGDSIVTIITNNSGIAVAPRFTANATSGTYVVSASVTGVTSAATFNLTNFCPASFIVTSSADSGPGTLRDIVQNSCPGITVTFDQSVSLITLTSGDININKPITITGPGADRLAISGNNLSRIFNVAATGIVNISGMTIRDGATQETDNNGGGGILITSGSLNIVRCLVTNNDASLSVVPEGGGIDNEGTGVVNITQSTISNNIAVEDGGGLANWGTSMTVSNSTIASNTSGPLGLGGGILSFRPLAVTNSTIYGNSAQAGGNVYRYGSSIDFRNSIIAGGTLVGTGGTGPDIYGTGFVSGDYNLVQNTAGGTITGVTTHLITGLNPALLPLANYGGTLPVLLPQPNSPAVNTGDPAITSGVDQRGFTRVSRGVADLGSVEANFATELAGGTPQTAAVTTPFAASLQARVTETGNPVGGVAVTFTAPFAGATGRFPGAALSAIDTTDGSGLAFSPVFTANDTVGTYPVSGRIGLAFDTVSYQLTNSIALPIRFGAVTATVKNCVNNIRWETLTETNNRNFTIEYSNNGTSFVVLDSIASKGNSNNLQLYNFSHRPSGGGMAYYRIKQTDVNGMFTYSNLIMVANNCGVAPVIAYPNPVRNKLTVVLPGTGRNTLTIHDPVGRMITQLNVGGGSHNINASNWVQGMYTLTVTQDGKRTYVLKVIKD